MKAKDKKKTKAVVASTRRVEDLTSMLQQTQMK